MSLIVQKFGGTSVADAEKIRAAARKAIRAQQQGHGVVMVVSAMGKNTLAFRLQAFVLGSAIMGLAGAVYAHFIGFISPEAFDPLFATFLVWVMLIAGGSGNNRGAILGAVIIWGVWSMTEYFTSRLPAEYVTQGAALRVFLIGLLLQIILLLRPQGLLPEVSSDRRPATRHNTAS